MFIPFSLWLHGERGKEMQLQKWSWENATYCDLCLDIISRLFKSHELTHLLQSYIIKYSLSFFFFFFFFTCHISSNPVFFFFTCHAVRTIQHLINFFPLYPQRKQILTSFNSSNIETCKINNERDYFKGNLVQIKKKSNFRVFLNCVIS